jgi:hypothetical protein
VPVRFGHRALGDHADLRAAADHDHAFPVDALKRRHVGHLRYPLQRHQVRHQPRFVSGAGYLELKLGRIR